MKPQLNIFVYLTTLRVTTEMWTLTTWIAGVVGGVVAVNIFLIVYSTIYFLADLWELKYSVNGGNDET